MRKLVLKKETVAELTPADLTHVRGGAITDNKYCTRTLILCAQSEVDACPTAMGCWTDTCAG